MDSNKKPSGPAFLLAQVGAHAAAMFRERLSNIKLTPPDAGILRMLATNPGISQQDLSTKLGIHPSRLVAIVDALESNGLVERKSNNEDRRQYALNLKEKGREALAKIGQIAREHQESLCAALTGGERATLANLLQKIAEQQELTEGVHPVYRNLRPGPEGFRRNEPSHKS